MELGENTLKASQMFNNVVCNTDSACSILSISDTVASICRRCFSKIEMLLRLYDTKLSLKPCLTEASNTDSFTIG